MVLIILFLLDRGSSFKRITSKNKDFWIGIGLWVLIPLFLFSMTETKVRWYILPIYPALSIMIGVLASWLLHKGKWLTKVILSVSIVSVSVYYEMQVVTYVNNPPLNPKQSLIEKVKDNVQTKGDSLYIYQPFGTVNWLQSEVLTAELADNLQVENGNFKEFIGLEKALLMIPKERYSDTLLKSNHLIVIASNEWGYIVQQSK